MAKNELQKQDGMTTPQQKNDAGQLNKFLKERIDDLMILVEATDCKGDPIIRLQYESEKDIRLKFRILKKALMDPKYRDQAIDEMLTDLLVAAYQDRLALMQIGPNPGYEGRVSILRPIQKMRQSADNHLINILRAFRDIKRPPVQVVVKQAQKVNIAEQMNQGDQQVNISKNQHGLNDLDGTI